MDLLIQLFKKERMLNIQVVMTSLIFLMLGANLNAQSLTDLQQNYKDGNTAEAAKIGQQLLEANPDDILVAHITGRALTDEKEFDAAIPLLEKVIASDETPAWMRAWTNGYLGVCYFAKDDRQNAKENLEKAIELDITENSTEFAQKRIKLYQLSPYYDNWKSEETDHIRMHFQPDIQIRDTKDYISKHEAAYQKANKFFKADPFKKVDIYVWGNPREGALEIGREVGSASSGVCIINAVPRQSPGHEINHILMDFGIQPIFTNGLINEGAAVYFDQENPDWMAAAKASLNGQKMDFEDLFETVPGWPERVIYPVGAAFIEFLLKKGDDTTLKAFLKEQTWEKLLELYGEGTVREFEAQF
ncbi:MAG: hypothetical protein R2879_15370 [Saprospiraceae bacterium]